MQLIFKMRKESCKILSALFESSSTLLRWLPLTVLNSSRTWLKFEFNFPIIQYLGQFFEYLRIVLLSFPSKSANPFRINYHIIRLTVIQIITNGNKAWTIFSETCLRNQFYLIHYVPMYDSSAPFGSLKFRPYISSCIPLSSIIVTFHLNNNLYI